MNLEGRFWVAGSTWPGEEGPLLNVFKRLRGRFPDVQLILVPRHMERRREVEQLILDCGLPYVRRGAMRAGAARTGGEPSPSVLLADTTGELPGYYAIATLVSVGKSFGVNHGGQNPIEPAAFSKPVITGPNMENFPGVMAEMLAAGALIQVEDVAGLEVACVRLLDDREQCVALGLRAGVLVASKRGVMSRTAARILEAEPSVFSSRASAR